MSESLVVNEIYLSLQGESTFAGLPCVFVRLTACNLRCSYCDTAYAFQEGSRMPLESVLDEVMRLARPFAGMAEPNRLPLVELTGGEPLLQRGSLELMVRLCDAGLTVLLETSGALDITAVDPRVRRIMDLKCPASGEADRNRLENIANLRPTDEVKFVIASVEDYQWAKEMVDRYRLAAICPVLFSWAAPLTPAQRHASLKPFPSTHTSLSRRELAERIVSDALPVRFQVQMHKVIWPPDERGV
ncbi:MAG TPA: radical SAM protein [Methylomirabilota bacterium]|nr:radical SAM protein [Methylomirabilota bacterium]